MRRLGLRTQILELVSRANLESLAFHINIKVSADSFAGFHVERGQLGGAQFCVAVFRTDRQLVGERFFNAEG